METFPVDKTKLLETLKTNRAAHRKEFEKAQTVFRQIVIKALDDYRLECEAVLDERLLDAKSGRRLTLRFAMPRLVTVPEPEEHTKDYDRAIQMVEWNVDDEVQLSERDFQNYVLNDWDWAESFMANTSSYTSGR